VMLEGAGIPLGPQFGSAGGSNPVAQNLLSSGSSADEDAAQAVNPTFDVVVAGVTNFYGAIISNPPLAADVIWIPVGKSFGPLYCRKIGLGFSSGPKLDVGYDGRVVLGPLDIDLQGLTVGIPLETPTTFDDYSLALDGLDISFDGGPVDVT